MCGGVYKVYRHSRRQMAQCFSVDLEEYRGFTNDQGGVLRWPHKHSHAHIMPAAALSPSPVFLN